MSPPRTVPLSLRLALMVGLLAVLSGAPAVAVETPVSGYLRAETVTVADLAADGTLLLSDGRRARLAGIELPRPPLGETAPALADLADRTRRALADMALSAPLILWTTEEAREDRWGRLPVLAATADGRWLQGELLRQGLARVMASRDDEEAVPALLAAEAPARTARAGLWADVHYALRRSQDTPRLLDSVQVVEGDVASITATKNAIYLNLGENRRGSLGVRIARRLVGDFAHPPLQWTGRRVRVRGFIGKSIGPVIDLDCALQIELVAPEDARQASMKDAP